MFYLVLGIHSVLCLLLIGVVMLQQGKGADLGAAFGGGSNTLFGASGANNILLRVTTSLAIFFMITSIILVNMYFNHARSSVGAKEPSLEGSVVPSQAASDTAAPAPVPQSESAAPQSAPEAK